MPGKGHFSWEPFPLPSADFLGSFWFFFASQMFLLFSESNWENKCGQQDYVAILWFIICTDFIRVSEWGYCRFAVPKEFSGAQAWMHIFIQKNKNSSSLWPLPPGITLDPCLLLFAYYNNTGSYLSPCYFSLMPTGIRPVGSIFSLSLYFHFWFLEEAFFLKLIFTMSTHFQNTIRPTFTSHYISCHPNIKFIVLGTMVSEYFADFCYRIYQVV